MTRMDTRTNPQWAHPDAPAQAQPDDRAFKLCSRGLALTTLVIALAGFAGTAFSAATPGTLFGQPANCMVSH